MEKLILFIRRHRWARRGLSALSVALVLTAVGLLGWPVYTNWQHDRLQNRLGKELASPQLEDKYRARAIEVGDALTRIKIPALDVDTVVVEGITMSALKAGAGHYPTTPLPCEDGNVSIAGHRTTYGKPFANIERLKPGDSVVLETPIGTCTYEVAAAPAGAKKDGAAAYIVQPTNLSVVANDPTKKTLTLTTCHPKGSAKQRLIIKATFVKGEPLPA